LVSLLEPDVTLTSTWKVPEAVGLPLSAPLELQCSPAGSPVAFQVVVPLVPDAVSWAE
jgi:hypothetical protein